MSHNVKIRYYARKNERMTPNSYYGQPIPNGTYGFEQLCAHAAKKTNMEAHDVRAAVEMYMDAAMEKLLDGFRVELGPQFVTLGPGLTAKVKDELNADGTVKKAATADDLTAIGAKSRITAVVNSTFSQQFADSVKWVKSDRAGNIIDPTADEDDATKDADDPTNGGGQSTGGGGSSQSGGSGSQGSGGGDGDDDVTYD